MEAKNKKISKQPMNKDSSSFLALDMNGHFFEAKLG